MQKLYQGLGEVLCSDSGYMPADVGLRLRGEYIVVNILNVLFVCEKYTPHKTPHVEFIK